MQVSVSQHNSSSPHPSLEETQQLAWIQRAFEEVLRVLGWPHFIPPADTSFFITTQMVLERIGHISRSEDHLGMLNHVFFNDLNPITYKNAFPAEIYFIAMRLTQRNYLENDDWKVSADPQKETIESAKILVNYTHIILEALRTRDHGVFAVRFSEFEKSWKVFLNQLMKEKNQHGCCWCGTFMLTNTLNALEKDALYQKRKGKIAALAKQICLNEESKLILSALNAEISSIVYKKIHQVEFKDGISLIHESVAEYVLTLTKDVAQKQVIEEMVKTKDFVFIDYLIELTAILSPDSSMLSCVKSRITDLHAKLKRLQDLHPKTGLESICRRVFETHARLVNPQYAIKNKDSKALVKDLADLNIEWELKYITGAFYMARQKDMKAIIQSLLLDYRLMMMQRVTGLAHQIIDLGLKTFEPKAFFAGYSKEITLLDIHPQSK